MSRENFKISKIDDRVFLSGSMNTNKKYMLQNLNITHILVIGTDLLAHFPNDFIYKHVCIEDQEDENIAQYFESCYDFIMQATGPVLVHCHAGMSRSATIVIYYLMRSLKLSYADAYSLCKTKRKCVGPNMAFIRQLQNATW